MIGMMMSSTSELTILPKAAPMMTPIARSKALPLKAKDLNSCHIEPDIAKFPRYVFPSCASLPHIAFV